MARKKYRNPAKGENTVIGKGTIIDGGITSDAMVIRVDGTVNGGIITEGDIIVGTDGIIKGDIKAASLILAGEITGNVDAPHRIEIEAGAKLIGDISTEILSMDETAILRGNVNMASGEEATETEAVEEKKEDKENE